MLELWRWKALKWEQYKEISATLKKHLPRVLRGLGMNSQIARFPFKKLLFSVKFNGDSVVIHYVGRERYIHGISASQTKYEIQ